MKLDRGKASWVGIATGVCVLGIQGAAWTAGERDAANALPCAPSVRDHAGGCLGASSSPELGKLYPLSERLFVSPQGDVMVNGTEGLEGAKLSVDGGEREVSANGLVVHGGRPLDPNQGNGGFGLKTVGGRGFDGGAAILGYGGEGVGDGIGFYGGYGGTGMRLEGGHGYAGGTGAEIRGGSTPGPCSGLGGTALTATGADGYGGGDGARLQGGNSCEGYGGRGALAVGGLGTFKPGGPGVEARGGPGCQGGAGVDARGGDAVYGLVVEGGTGLVGRGGYSINGPQGTGVLGEGRIGVQARSTDGPQGPALFSEGRLLLATAPPGQGGPVASLGFDAQEHVTLELGESEGLIVTVGGEEALVVKAQTPPLVRVRGDLQVEGSLSKSGGTFRIDHPLDPEHRTLTHSFVESSERMNVYNGNVVLGDDGAAWVELPAWFEALNRDPRYQLTCIGGFAPVHVAETICGNRFRIAGGVAGLEVSWQVTGVRDDAWARAHPLVLEEPKRD